MPNTIGTPFLALLLLVAAVGTTFGQGVDKGCSGTVANPCGGSGSSSGGSSGGGRSIWSRPARDPADDARQKRLNEAHAANERGVAFYKNGDYANALKAFQEAVDKNPDSENLKKNLAHAKEELQFQLDREAEDARQARLSADAAKKMTTSMQNLADSLTATPASSGLEFGDMKDLKDSVADTSSLNYVKGANDPCKPAAGSLTFGDPQTVDARCVPSGLTKFTEDSIEKSFAKSPPGVGERVRKGFQALMTQDRNAAKTWFEDALSRDPKNEELKRLVDLLDHTLKYQARAKVVQLPQVQPGKLQLPEKGDEQLLFDAGNKPEKVRMPAYDEDIAMILNNAPKRSVKGVVSDVAFAVWNELTFPVLVVTFDEGHLSIYPVADDRTVMLPEGPFVIGKDGNARLSTNHEDFEIWKQTYVGKTLPPENMPKKP